MHPVLFLVVFAATVTATLGEDDPNDLFCKQTNTMCRTEKKFDELFKVSSAEACLQKCLARAKCTGVNYLEDEEISQRCQLVKGKCRPDVELGPFYGMTVYTRREENASCPEKDNEPYCAEGDEEVVSDTYKETGGIPTAHCPDNHIITRCECNTGHFNGICSEMRINEDMRSCTVKPKIKITYQRARACCRPLKDNVVPYYDVTREGELSYTCPEKTEAICSKFYSPSAVIPSEGLSLTNDADKRKCEAQNVKRWSRWAEPKGKLSVICLGTYEANVVDDRACTDTESQVEPSGVAEGAGSLSEATCPEGTYAAHCACDGGGKCGGTSVSEDGRTCKAHGAEGVQVKAKICCATSPAGRGAIILSNPEEEDSSAVAPYVDCPEGKLITCLLTSPSGSEVYVDGNRCWSAYSCKDCRIQVVCTRNLLEPVGEFKCAEGEREVIGAYVSGEQESKARCKWDSESVRRCDCEEESGRYCMNVGVTSYDTCEAFGVKGLDIRVRAKACCQPEPPGKTEYHMIKSVPDLGRGRVRGVSVPVSHENDLSQCPSKTLTLPLGPYFDEDRWKYFDPAYVRGVQAPSAECYDDTELVYCNLIKMPSTAFPSEAPIVEGNTCRATGFCQKCAVDLVCQLTNRKK